MLFDKFYDYAIIKIIICKEKNMNVALVLAFLFYVGSSFGWVLELFFRRFISKKWFNPGFLTGPYLPIYGVGLSALFLLSLIDMSFIENVLWRNILIIIFMGMIMTAIEYIAGCIFIKGLKVKLWDYSNMWGNIDGIICPLYTFLWSVLGAIYYFFIQSHMIKAVIWLSNNLAFSFVIGFFFGILTIDITHSMNLVVKLRKFAKENEILVKFEELKNHIREDQEKRREKINYLFAFKTTKNLSDTLAEYKNKLETKNNNCKGRNSNEK